MSARSKPSIVFAHGIWADGSSFSKLIPTLQTEGREVIAAQYGLDTLAGDVAALKSVLGRVRTPIILVGHSYGGTLITAAGVDPRVVALVEVTDGRVWLKPGGIATFAGDLSEQEQKIVWATHAAPAADLFSQKVEGTAWKSKPSWYIVASADRTVQPELQRFA